MAGRKRPISNTETNPKRSTNMTQYGVRDANGEVTAVDSTNDGGEDVVAPATATPADEGAVANSQPAEDAGVVASAPGTGDNAERAEDSKEAAAAQREEDAKFLTDEENANKPLVRGANPDVGGESF